MASKLSSISRLYVTEALLNLSLVGQFSSWLDKNRRLEKLPTVGTRTITFAIFDEIYVDWKTIKRYTGLAE